MSLHIPQTLIAAGAALVVASALIPPIRRIAIARGVVALPRVERWSGRSTPYLGGVAIALASVGVAAVESHGHVRTVIVVIAALAVSVIGLVDDIRPASISVRLAIESCAALAVALVGIRPHLLPMVPDIALTVVLLVVLANAFNYVDNIDGALGVVSVAISASIAVAALLTRNDSVAIEAAGVLGACLGFTIFNWHPASIFMGDAGSLFLGFFLGTLLLDLRLGTSPPSRALCIVLTMSVPLFDMAIVYLARMRSGRPLHVGGTDHTSHRLIHAGVPIRITALILLAASALSGAVAVAVGRARIPPGAALVVLFIVTVPACVLVLRLDDPGSSR